MPQNAVCCAATLFVAMAGLAAGADWPQWRGPERNGLAGGDVALAESWGEKGPPEVWKSEEIPSGDWGGWGSPVVAGQKVYVYVNLLIRVPLEPRKLTAEALGRLGWFPEKLSAELSKAVEEARVSEERTKLMGNELGPWVQKWVNDHFSEAERKTPVARIAADRLQRGKNAMAFETLDKLATIKDKEFPNQAELDKWFDQNGIDEATREGVRRVIATYRDEGEDVVYCLDAVNGKTLWKTAQPGRPKSLSGTVCVADGRCYVSGSSGELYCLDAGSGKLLWKAKAGAANTSPLEADGKVIALTSDGYPTAFDVKDGKVLWTQNKVRSSDGSPVCWQKDGRTYLICSGYDSNASCVELETGKLLWTAPGSKYSTAAVAGDHMITATGSKEVGLTAYKLSVEKAEKLWNVPEITESVSSPLIHDGRVYSANGDKGDKLYCVDLAAGKILWSLPARPVQCCSPVLADGKIVVVRGEGLGIVKPSPDKGELVVAKAKPGMATFASPAIADGKVYLRQRQSVACFDLSAGAAASGAAETGPSKK
jgi:outer membrane protein assembly factor BamB